MSTYSYPTTQHATSADPRVEGEHFLGADYPAPVACYEQRREQRLEPELLNHPVPLHEARSDIVARTAPGISPCTGRERYHTMQGPLRLNPCIARYGCAAGTRRDAHHSLTSRAQRLPPHAEGRFRLNNPPSLSRFATERHCRKKEKITVCSSECERKPSVERSEG